jgi:hypothetical protein
MGKIPIVSHKARRISPFDDLWFWPGLATIDFCALLGMGASNGEEHTSDKENT